MSSKVLSSSDGRSATPIAWGKLDETPAPPVKNESGQDDQVPQLQAALEHLKQRHDNDVSAAHRHGFAEGEAHAKLGPAAEMEAATRRMAESVRELAQLRPRLRRDAEADVVRLALAIARRILRREMSVDPAAMQALAQVALQKLGRQEISRVFTHPHQAPAIKSALEAAGIRAEVCPRNHARIGSPRISNQPGPSRCLGKRATRGNRTRPHRPPQPVMTALNLQPYLDDLERIDPFRSTGVVDQLIGLLIESAGPSAAIGDFCSIETQSGRRIRTQVIGFRNGHVLSMPLEETDGLRLGDLVLARSGEANVSVGPATSRPRS